MKPVELKPATEVSTAMSTEKEKGVKGARTTTEESEKRPRSGIVLKKAEEVQQHDAGEKAPHRESSDEADDAELADHLQKASSFAGTSRKGQEGSDGPRSVEGICGDEETRAVETSSKITVSGVDDDPYVRCPLSAARKRQGRDAGERRSRVSQRRQQGLGRKDVLLRRV